MRASNKNLVLSRKSIKIDKIFGNIFSFLSNFLVILMVFNNMINNLEAKQILIHSLYRNYRMNNQIVKKIKLIREGFNEISDKDELMSKEVLLDKEIPQTLKTEIKNNSKTDESKKHNG